jgi:hypothetical protein
MENRESIFYRLLSAKQARNKSRNDKISLQAIFLVSRNEIVQIPAKETSGFTYNSLDKSVNSIRLLLFEEGYNGHSIIQYNLVYKMLREKLVYFALSYT